MLFVGEGGALRYAFSGRLITPATGDLRSIVDPEVPGVSESPLGLSWRWDLDSEGGL